MAAALTVATLTATTYAVWLVFGAYWRLWWTEHRR